MFWLGIQGQCPGQGGKGQGNAVACQSHRFLVSASYQYTIHACGSLSDHWREGSLKNISQGTMASAERLVTTWMASGRDEEVAEAVTEVSDGRLLGLVKALGTYLTSEEDALRTKGVDFLATVISSCPPNALNRQSVKVLTAFFCDKLDDTETIVPALKGLASLPPICAQGDALVIVNAVFKHVNMRALVQSVRFLVFSIIDGLIAHHRETLKEMKRAFIAPYIALADGEKDPRNLLVAFAIARVILIEFDPAEHIEALSNILFCYFPITFRPPPNDPYGISADDLRVALRQCLCAHPAFGPLAIPIFLEKLAAGSPTIKRDTLDALTACFPVYGRALARMEARKLWNAIKLEIFQPIDPTTEAAALLTLQALVVTIHAADDDGDAEEVKGLAHDACEECIGILREPEKSMAKPAIKVLCAFVATTPSVARYTLAHAVPHLLKLLADPNEVPTRHPVLLLLSDLIAAAREAGKADSNVISESSNDISESAPPLAPYKDAVLGALVSGVAAPATTRAALAGLTGLVSTPRLLSDAELGFVVLKVNEVLERCFEEGGADDSNAILKLLMTISSTAPTHVRDLTLPMLLRALPASAPPRAADAERTRYQHVLSALSTLSTPPPLCETLVAGLVPLIGALALGDSPQEDSAMPPPQDADDSEPAAAYLHALLATLRRTLAGKVDDGHADVAGYADTLVPVLYGLAVRAALHGHAGTPMREPRVLGVVGEIVGLVVQSLGPARQQTFAAALVPAFLEGKIAAICAAEHVSSDDRFLPFTADAPPAVRNLLVLFEAGVVPLDPTVALSADTSACAEAVLERGLAHAETARQAEAVCRVVGSIVNKHVDELAPFLEHKEMTYWAERVADPTSGPVRRREAIRAWTWICKGLLVRNHPRAGAFVERLFSVFGDADKAVGAEAAKAFGELAAADGVLTKRNKAVVKFLWAQKFASGILPRLMGGARDGSDPAQQHAHLIALTALLKAIPHAAYAHEMAQLLPLLMRALQLPDAQIRSGVLETLLASVSASLPTSGSAPASTPLPPSSSPSPALAEHAPALARQVLAHAAPPKDAPTSVRTRLAALRLLAALPAAVRYAVLHPARPAVLRGLAAALDDPRRAVRREAVDAREIWFKYTG
ncbi:Dos2-interacting transcription regulator of RNA-Pol-II-domain-containing protein [Mycena rosella]|uniref:MMS19 nucleotide excision repair protein n=1 Tax=Mycena rosella TaxID=1033263 RepID=A0AAD7DLM1_MYCRO|nr:Dos2-interacting transcription regulator of RNA-Pol-II-domain-containing protein [Mycena rosella]